MRDCANCFHRKPVLKEDGTWTAECEKWDCEFQSRDNMIEKTKAMNNDLISRSALIQHAYSAVVDGVEKDIIDLSDVDNSPTVEPIKQCKFCKHCGNEDYCSNCHSDHSLFEYYERPKGKWIETQRGIHVTDYKCSCCGRTVRDDTGYDVASDYPFCNCGADMRGEEE